MTSFAAGAEIPILEGGSRRLQGGRLTAPARYPSTGSRASCRAGSWAGTAARCGAARTPSAEGLLIGRMPACSGRKPPLLRLQGAHAVTTLSQRVRPPKRARDQVVEGQVVLVPTVLAAEAVAQEHVKPGERGIERRLHVGLEGHHGGQPHLEGRAAHEALVLGDDIHPIQEDGLDRLLPAPQRQRVIAQRPKIGIQHKRREAFGRGGVGVHEPVSVRPYGCNYGPASSSAAILAPRIKDVKPRPRRGQISRNSGFTGSLRRAGHRR